MPGLFTDLLIYMENIQLERKDRLALLTLNRGRANAINTQLLLELKAAVQELDADNEIGGLVIAGKENFFSAGVDLIDVFRYNEEQTREFWTEFLAFQAVLAGFKKPFVTAITGHSPAGGCIIALCSDYRVMAKGDFIIGLNEVPVGIIVPDSVFELYSFWIGRAKAYRFLLEGKLLKADEALANGLIDELAEPSEVIAAAGAKARALMSINPVTWQQTKLNLRRELLDSLRANNTRMLDGMIKHWWSDETRTSLQKMIDKLTKPAKVN
jgi:enoyl-CoA hydratase/carnithine racemase